MGKKNQYIKALESVRFSTESSMLPSPKTANIQLTPSPTSISTIKEQMPSRSRSNCLYQSDTKTAELAELKIAELDQDFTATKSSVDVMHKSFFTDFFGVDVPETVQPNIARLSTCTFSESADLNRDTSLTPFSAFDPYHGLYKVPSSDDPSVVYEDEMVSIDHEDANFGMVGRWHRVDEEHLI